MLCRLLGRAALLLAVVTGSTATAEDQGRNANRNVVPKTETTAVATPEKESNSAAPKPRNPRVLFITAKNSDACEKELRRLNQSGGVFEGMRASGWKIGETPDNHIQIVDRETIPELVKQLNVREFPTVACINDGEIVRSFKDGCSTPLDAWTFGWLIKGHSERPQAVIPEEIRVATTGQYPLRGNHWSVDGDWNPSRETVIAHIRGENHARQIVSSEWQIDTWSYEELRSLHDDLHEREDAPILPTYAQSPLGQTGVRQFGAGRKF